MPGASPNPFSPGYYGSEELRTFGFKRIGDNVRIARNCTIVGLENIEIGDNSRIDGFCSIIAETGHLKLADYVHIHTNCVIGCRGGVDMEDFSSLASGVRVLSACDELSGRWMVASVVPPEFTSPRVSPITLAKHAVVAVGSTVLPGVSMAEGALLGAHSFTGRSLSPWTIYCGNPARAVGSRERRALEFEQQIRQRLMKPS